MNFEYLSQTEYLNNSIANYIIFLSLIVIGLLVKGLVSKYLSSILYKLIGKKEQRVGSEKFNELLSKPIGFFIMLSIIYIGFSYLQYPKTWNLAPITEFGLKMCVHKAYYLLYVYAVLVILMRITDYIGLILLKKSEETANKMDDQLVPFGIEVVKFIIIIFGLFIILGNVFGVDVTALAAGLGIGGIALAMASKDSLENLLGSFTIFFDKPFTVGDIVTIGSVTGSVEKVGFRSTRIKTFDKSIVTVPNKTLIAAELDNLGLRPVRRVKFYVGLTYDTSIDQIKKIVKEMAEMVDRHPKTNNDGKVKFQEFGSSSLDILVVYYVDSPRWDDLVDVREDINYKIMEIIKRNGSDFAFPSSTIYLQKQ